MSKLRAAITWEHLQKSNSVELFPPSFLEENIEDQINVEHKEFEEFDEEFCEVESESEEFEELISNKDFDNKLPDSNSLETEFNQFLDVWVEISVRETEESTDIDEEDDEMISSAIEDIVHPAVDSNAKWNLNLLFNELQLPS